MFDMLSWGVGGAVEVGVVCMSLEFREATRIEV